MSDTQVIKFDVGAKYILIVKDVLDVEQKKQIMNALDKFVHDDNIQLLMISDLDCTLEKIAAEDLNQK